MKLHVAPNASDWGTRGARKLSQRRAQAGELIQRIMSNRLVKGVDGKDNVVGHGWVEWHGGAAHLAPAAAGRPTTGIVERVRTTDGEA